MNKIKIISAPDFENPYAVIYKPKNLPSAPLEQSDKENALDQALELFPELAGVHGKKEIEHGLLHRLDTPTDGLILIAATQSFYDFMQEEQAEGRFIKYYSAVCVKNKENPSLLDNFPPFDFEEGSLIESFFRSFGKGAKEVRPVTQKSGMAALKKVGKQTLYRTEIVSVTPAEDYIDGNAVYNVTCRISQGFRHQVRCHLAWAGLPIINDPVYNAAFRNHLSGDAHSDDEHPLQFSATRIEFTNPVNQKLKIFNAVL